MRCYRPLVAVLLSLVLALVVACGNGRQTTAQGQSPTPAPTISPQELAPADADAIRLATDLQRLPGENFASTGAHTIANLTSVQWVRTTAQSARQWFPAVGAVSPVWVFKFTGDFYEFNFAGVNPTVAPTGPGGPAHTLYMLVQPNSPAPFETEAGPPDLSVFGAVHTIEPGTNQQIDALRGSTGKGGVTPSPPATPTP